MLNEQQLKTIITNVIHDLLTEIIKFNPKSLSNIPNLHDRISVLNNKLPVLGRGSSRKVFKLDSKKVIKMAINEAGIAQNNAELDVITNPKIKPIFAKIFDYDRGKETTWLVCELVRPLTYEDFAEMTGYYWSESMAPFLMELDLYARKSFNDFILENFENEQHIYFSNPLYRDIFYAVKYGDLVANDLRKIGQWGKTANGRIVILDYGLDEATLRQYY